MKLSLHGTATSPDLRFRRYYLFSHRKSLKSSLPTSDFARSVIPRNMVHATQAVMVG
ncbi:hypothetical protein SO802_018772 [Lithocarpus litseifolius]|uniref:Uncharacterized protein n=1 Tax=Lithocarpus litseifolius TaxID=425828 RepID=A0AAW2CQZ3_9ROSI